MATRSSRICRFDKQASDHLSDAFALTQTVVLQSQPLTTNPFVPNAAPVSKLYTVQGKDILQVSEAVTAAIKMVSLHSQYNSLVATFPRCYATLPSGHDALHGHLVLAQHAVRFDRSEMERTREGETWYLLSVLSNVLTITRISQTMPVREHSPCSQWRLGCSYPRMLRKKPCSITVSCAVHWRSLHTRLSCSQDSPPEEVFQLVRVWKNYSTSSETMISDLPSKG